MYAVASGGFMCYNTMRRRGSVAGKTAEGEESRICAAVWGLQTGGGAA